ncbi:MAG: alpha-ribazole phosphatase family protein [Pseudomonadota bacterium]
MSLIALRHTTPDVAPGTCYGRTDLSLADSFEAEFAALLPGLPDAARIVSSPLARCHILAGRIAERRAQQVEIDPRLIEMVFGAWEGLDWSDIPRAELDAWAADFLHARPHGGESVAQLRDRVGSILSDLRADGRTHLLVTHSGVVKAALATGDRAEDYAASLGFGEWIHLPRAA